MKNLLLLTGLISLSFCATANSFNNSNVYTNSYDAPKNDTTICPRKSVTLLRSGFYVTDNVEGGVIERITSNTNDEFLPIKAIEDIQLSYEKYDRYTLYINIDSKASRKLQTMTRNYIGGHMAIIINDEVIQTANIQAVLSSSFRITGLNTLQEAEALRSKIECAIS